LDNIFIEDPQHSSGKHAVPMSHQFEINRVEAGDVLNAVSKVLTAGEQLLQIAEAACHGLASYIDDFRVRQNQVNEANVAEIIRHFIGEEQLVSTIGAGITQVAFAKRAEFGGREPGKNFRVQWMVWVRIEIFHLADHTWYFRKLLRAIDL